MTAPGRRGDGGAVGVGVACLNEVTRGRQRALLAGPGACGGPQPLLAGSPICAPPAGFGSWRAGPGLGCPALRWDTVRILDDLKGLFRSQQDPVAGALFLLHLFMEPIGLCWRAFTPRGDEDKSTVTETPEKPSMAPSCITRAVDTPGDPMNE